MKNDFLEQFIKDNICFKVSKKYVNELEIELTDKNNDKMTIMQCFEYVKVLINNEYFNTYYLKDGNWLCKANLK